VAGGAIRLYEVAPPKILDPCRVEGQHSDASAIWIVLRHIAELVSSDPPGSSLSPCAPSQLSTRDLSRKVSHPVKPVGEVKQFLLGFRDMRLSS
jgi:hypothetical protein